MMAMTKQREIDFDKMSIAAIRDMARDSSSPHQNQAAREYVTILIDLEVERRLVIMHNNTGYAPISPTALAGELVGGGVRGDAMLASYRRGQGGSTYWHDEAQRALRLLSVRSQVAILIRHVKSDTRLEGEWSATYDQIAASIPYYCQKLGFSPHPFEPEMHSVVQRILRKCGTDKSGQTEEIEREGTEIIVPKFKNGESIRNCASDAAYKLIDHVKFDISTIHP